MLFELNGKKLTHARSYYFADDPGPPVLAFGKIVVETADRRHLVAFTNAHAGGHRLV